MNNIELKKAIANDLETIKHLELEIIPAQTYYRDLLKIFVSCVSKIGIVIFLTVIYASTFNPSKLDMVSEPWMPLITGTAFSAFFMALGSMLFLGVAITNYYLIKYHLEKRLQTGPLLIKTLRQLGWMFYCLFSVLCLFFGSCVESAAIYTMIVFSFLISGFLTQFFLGMEIKRIGLSAIFTVITAFFAKGKNA